MISRREFSKKSATAMAALPLLQINHSLLTSSNSSKGDLDVNLFSKHLQFLDYNDMSAAAAEIGFDGVDLAVRPKGHVLPENVAEDLPKAVASMKKYGLNTQMFTSNVWNLNNEYAKKVLEVASKEGFSHYRTGWLTYPEDISIVEGQTIFAGQAVELGEVNKSLGLVGGYQNHTGKHVGAPIWDLPAILDGADNTYMGCQYDIRHAVVEGGGSWELGLRRIKPFINSIVIKDFKWGIKDGKWKPINTPLGEGMVDFGTYFSLLKKYDINVPISLHLEYGLGGAEHGAKEITMDKNEIFRIMKKDLTFIREAWKKAE